MPQESSAGGSPSTSASDHQSLEPYPRAFVVSLGLWFQAVGSVMFFGACCIWSMSGTWVAPIDDVPARWLDYLSTEHRARALTALNIVVTVVGGLAMIGAGIGMYGERRRSGILGVVVSGILAVIFLVTATILVFVDGEWGAGLLAGALGAILGLLTLPAMHAASVLSRFPPPPDLNDVTPEFMERYRRERDERRKKYDL